MSSFVLPRNLDIGHSTAGDHHHHVTEHGLDAAGMDYVNDRKQVKLTMALLAVMAILSVAILVFAVYNA